MLEAGLGFVVANLLLLRVPVPVDLVSLTMALPVALLGLGYRHTRLLAGFVLGLLVTWQVVEWELGRRLPEQQERLETTVAGRIVGLPVIADDIARFQFRVEQGRLAGSNLRLTWYRPERVLVPGDRWSLPVKLSPPGGSVNFDLFDYEGWQFLKRIHATGYVAAEDQARQTGRVAWAVDRWRYQLKSRLESRLSDERLATFLALALGDTSQLSRAHWEILNATGTTHLLIVSGLHIGLIATLAFTGLKLAGAPLSCLAAGTLLVTGGYALFAGWGLPVQRAFIMVAAMLLGLMLRRHLPLLTRWYLALLAVIIMDPMASLGNGFWLSFGVVLALITGLQDRPATASGRANWLTAGVSTQWVACLSLLPLLGFIHHELPVASFLVNLVAIPMVGLLVVPLMLAGLLVLVVVEPVGMFIIDLAGLLVQQLWRLLEAVARADLVLPTGSLTALQVCAGIAGAICLLLPRGLTPRWPGLLLLLLMITGADRGEPDELTVTFLDVGQGLSVLVETPGHSLLYDTGPAFGDRFSAARQVVLPTLRMTGWTRLDALIISHDDNDHAGGEQIIRHDGPVGRTLRQGQCDASWVWDEVSFHAFGSRDSADRNNSSCLLLIETTHHRVLFTGDIEAAAEYVLLTRLGQPVTLMSAPHHGSESSSTPALINATLPDLVVVSAGYRNRFGHPDPVVLARYAARSVRVLNTAIDGAVRVRFNDVAFRVETARKAHPARWRRQ